MLSSLAVSSLKWRMDSQEVLDSHEKLVKLGLTIANPKISPESDSGTTLLPWFKWFFVVHVSFCLATSTYCVTQLEETSFTSVTEPAALSSIKRT